jgi:hypothetical protein
MGESWCDVCSWEAHLGERDPVKLSHDLLRRAQRSAGPQNQLRQSVSLVNIKISCGSESRSLTYMHIYLHI